MAKAVDQALQACPPQSEEFNRRFKRLVENAIRGTVDDSDVRKILELISSNSEADE